MPLNISQPKKAQNQINRFSAEFYQIFKDLISILFKLFQQIETEGTLPNSFYEVTVTLITKPHKDPKMKENLRPIFFMNINTKIFNKILENQIQEYFQNDRSP